MSPYAIGHDAIDFTVSIGVATASDYSGLDALMNLADKALYRAKRLGRNRVEPLPHCVEQQSIKQRILAI
jgi:PleD family two-component response regulator